MKLRCLLPLNFFELLSCGHTGACEWAGFRVGSQRLQAAAFELSKDTRLCFCFFQPGSSYVVQAGLRLEILLPQATTEMLSGWGWGESCRYISNHL